MLIDYSCDVNSLDEAFLYGNSFPSLYKGYKDYEVLSPVITSDKEALLLEIMMLDFGINDLYIYLLNHTDDKEKLSIMNEYIEAYNKDVCLYNKTYGKIDYSMGGAYV